MELPVLFPARSLKERGYRRPEKERIAAVIAYLSGSTQGPVFRHKLHKLFYFADLLHFYEEGRTISGFAYHSTGMGPVPERGDLLYEVLVLEGRIRKKEFRFPASDYFGTAFEKGDDGGENWLNKTEQGVLDELIRNYKQATPALLIEESLRSLERERPLFVLP
ncbi:MAG: Panacea domain-containing protein [Flavobacteriales bacterium]